MPPTQSNNYLSTISEGVPLNPIYQTRRNYPDIVIPQEGVAIPLIAVIPDDIPIHNPGIIPRHEDPAIVEIPTPIRDPVPIDNGGDYTLVERRSHRRLTPNVRLNDYALAVAMTHQTEPEIEDEIDDDDSTNKTPIEYQRPTAGELNYEKVRRSRRTRKQYKINLAASVVLANAFATDENNNKLKYGTAKKGTDKPHVEKAEIKELNKLFKTQPKAEIEYPRITIQS